MLDRTTRALAFNAVAPALRAQHWWMPLSVRRAVSDAVLAAIEPAARPAPAEYCGETPPVGMLLSEALTRPLVSAAKARPLVECVLRPGHSGSHAAEDGMRWSRLPSTNTTTCGATLLAARLGYSSHGPCLQAREHPGQWHEDAQGARWWTPECRPMTPANDGARRCHTGDHPPHDGFTCGEVNATRPYWNVRWDQEAAVERVRALHHDWENDPGHCAHCTGPDGTLIPFPCATITALGGPTSADQPNGV